MLEKACDTLGIPYQTLIFSDSPPFRYYENKAQASSAFWMEERDAETIRNAEALGAVVIRSYPDKFFENTYTELFHGTLFADQIRNILENSKFEAYNFKNTFLDCIQAAIQGFHLYSDTMACSDSAIWHDFFWMMFSERTGNTIEARCYANKLSSPAAYKSLIPQHQIMVLDTIMMTNREIAKFLTYRKKARELYFLSKKQKNKAETYHAILQIIGSYQMEIPHYLHFKIPLRMQKIGMTLFVRLSYAVLNTYFAILKVLLKTAIR